MEYVRYERLIESGFLDRWTDGANAMQCNAVGRGHGSKSGHIFYRKGSRKAGLGHAGKEASEPGLAVAKKRWERAVYVYVPMFLLAFFLFGDRLDV